MNKLFRTTVMSVVSLVLCFSMTACDKKPVETDSTTEMPISEIVLKELIKKEYAGRLVGTQGNEKAVKYLENYMKELGIEPFSYSDYTMSYTQVTGDPNKQNTKVVVTLKDGSMRELVHGKDFYTNAARKPINVDLPLGFNPDKVTLETIPVIGAEDIMKIKEPGEVCFFWQETSTLVVGTPETKGIFNIHISKKLRDELEKAEAVSAKITADCVPVESYPDNVVGIIKGKPDTENVIALTAHMDHVGEQGDFLFSGVIDNASGTGALMSTAAKIKKLTEGKVLDYDIVIAAVNSEETNSEVVMLNGSKKVAEVLAKNYSNVQNINIDCVGMKPNFELNMGFTKNKSKPIMQSFRDKLTSASIAFDEKEYATSDHVSFERMGYPAFTVGGFALLGGLLHSTTYTADDIDFDYVEKLSQVIAEFVVEADTLFTQTTMVNVDNEPGSDEWRNQANAELEKILNGKKLALNECIYFEFGDGVVRFSSRERITNVEDVSKCYPTIKLPKEIAGYKFSGVKIGASEDIVREFFTREEIPVGITLNEVCTVEKKVDNIRYMEINYNKGETVLDFIVNKIEANDVLSESNEQVELKLTEPSYEPFSLKSMDEGKSYYTIAYEKNGYRINVATRDEKTFAPEQLSKEEMMNRIEEFGLK